VAVTVVILFKTLSIHDASLIASILFISTGLETLWISYRLKEKISIWISTIFLIGMALPIGAMRILIGGRDEIQAAGFGDVLNVLHRVSSPTFMILILICLLEWLLFEKKKFKNNRPPMAPPNV
jgi:ABC-type Mn2+/Zn2+ transport system permease subunit